MSLVCDRQRDKYTFKYSEDLSTGLWILPAFGGAGCSKAHRGYS